MCIKGLNIVNGIYVGVLVCGCGPVFLCIIWQKHSEGFVSSSASA